MAVTEAEPTKAPAWNSSLLENPHAVADKRQRVQRMFAAIAPSYDLNNRLHSLWMDQHWRKKAVRLAGVRANERVVDIACGTGDLIEAFRQVIDFLPGAEDRPSQPQYLGIDFTYEMLPIAARKSNFFAIASRIRYINGDAQSIPLPDACCDVVSIAFGIRNVQDPAAALSEFFRILRPGGRLIILEFSLPTNPMLRGLYHFYFHHVLPTTATLISGDKTGAYKYLPQSVDTFISRQRMDDMMREAGFDQTTQFPMTFGICVCYRGIKPGGVQ